MVNITPGAPAVWYVSAQDHTGATVCVELTGALSVEPARLTPRDRAVAVALLRLALERYAGDGDGAPLGAEESQERGCRVLPSVHGPHERRTRRVGPWGEWAPVAANGEEETT